MHYPKMWQVYLIGLLYSTTLTFGQQPQIVIIGAGASGIAAASKLLENGFQNITILEAENRIGGRVYTTWFDESWVDLGGQWVVGQTDNIAFEMAWPLGLLEVPPEKNGSECVIYTSKGVQIPNSIIDPLFQSYDTIGDREDFTVSNSSVGDYLTRVMNAEFEKYPTINETLAGQLIKIFETIVAETNAVDNWYELSMSNFMEYWDSAGSNLVNWKERAYGTIFDVLMKKYPNPEEELPVLNNTLLNSEVVNINYNSIDGKAVVKMSDGKEYVADHVITTPSLGVLKAQHETLFTPQLPEAKVKTIQGLGFGTIAKVYLTFEAPWWPEDPPSFEFIWDHEDRQEYENDVDKKWLLGLNDFTAVAHRPRLLCGWLFGASARQMENLPEDQVFNQTFSLLNKFLGKSYNVTKPTGILRTQWHNRIHFRGTYSFRSMETEKANVGHAELSNPLLVNDKPVVLFAGEATSPHRFGTVHGAIETGLREANRIVDLYKTKSE